MNNKREEKGKYQPKMHEKLIKNMNSYKRYTFNHKYHKAAKNLGGRIGSLPLSTIQTYPELGLRAWRESFSKAMFMS